MQLTVLVPNYNGKKLLETNVPRLITIVPQERIVIVDDASTDGSVEFIKKKYPRIVIIEKVTNNGFATAVNLGMKAVNSEVVFLLNSDAIPHNDTIDLALTHFKDPNVAIVACLDESVEGGNVVQRGRGIGVFTRGFLLHKRGEVDKDNTLWASGGSSFFRKSIWEKLNGFNELYNPFYWEDIDFSYRALKSGYKIIFEPRSKVEHHHEKGSILSQFRASFVKTIAYRNQFIFVWSVISDPAFLFSHVFWLPIHLLRAIYNKDPHFINGFLQALKVLPTIIKIRSGGKKLFNISDKKVLAPYKEEYHS